MTIHTLKSEKHNDFLKQERIDPIISNYKIQLNELFIWILIFD